MFRIDCSVDDARRVFYWGGFYGGVYQSEGFYAMILMILGVWFYHGYSSSRCLSPC